MPKKKQQKKKAERNGGPRPILVPIDFSAHSRAALLWAAGAARCLEVPLVVLHVVHDPAATPGYYRTKKKGLRRMEDAAAEMMEDFLENLRADHPSLEPLRELTAKLVIGLTVSRILEVIEKVDAQLVVVGSQGRTGLPHLLLGSKAERVAQLATVPVTIVKADKAPVSPD